MITKFKKFQIIKESPDQIDYDEDLILSHNNDDAIPFFADVNKDHTELLNVVVGDYRQWHSDIDYDYEGNKAYAGRLWMEHKVISFWVYPNVDLFKKIIEGLENDLNIKIFNNGWELEVITEDSDDDDNEIIKYQYQKRLTMDEEEDDDYYDEDDDYFRPLNQPYGNKKIIPIEEYIGSANVPVELQIQHLMNWKEKQLAKKMGKIHFKGFGSDRTAWDSPHNIKHRQRIYQENKNN